MSKVKSINIETPWGNITIDKDGINSLGIIKFALTQCLFSQKEGNDSDHLKRDISGYEMIINSLCPEFNSSAFLKTKHAAVHAKEKFKDNLAVIEYLKNNKIWNRGELE